MWLAKKIREEKKSTEYSGNAPVRASVCQKRGAFCSGCGMSIAGFPCARMESIPETSTGRDLMILSAAGAERVLPWGGIPAGRNFCPEEILLKSSGWSKVFACANDGTIC